MENINMKIFLKYLKDNDMIRMYQTIFDRYLDINLLFSISDNEIELIMSENKYESIVSLYEVINGIKINEDVKKYIYSLENSEIIKYCLRLSISQDFTNDDQKMRYIKALSESNNEVVKFAYGIASSKLYINSEDGINYVKIVGKCEKNIVIPLINLLHSDKYSKDEELFEFVNLVKDAKEDYIAEYMIELFKNEDFRIQRIPLSNISVLLCSKGSFQAYLTYCILTNEELLKKEDVTIIAMCEDERNANKGYIPAIDEKVSDGASNIIYNITNNSNDKVKVKSTLVSK